MDSSLREKLSQLTSKSEVLAKNARYVECIDIMEEIVSIKKNVYGIDHPEFQKSSQKLCQYLNLAAMVHLQKEKFQASLQCLRKAQLVARNSLQFKATTFNNLACYYRRTGKIRTALTYLIQALELQLKTQQPKTLADTHLNLCAVLSQLDRHQDALQHVMLSIILLQDEFLQITMPYAIGVQETDGEQPINDERLAVLAIAYHNLGVEFEHLKRFEEAVKIYKKALKLSKEYLSNNEQLIQNLAKVVSSATQQIEDQKKSSHQTKRQRYERQMSQNKKQLYKDLAKNTQKMRNLPKLKVNKDSFAVSSTSNIEAQNRTSYDKKGPKMGERQFATRKHPRYYKSFAVTPSNDDRSYDQSQIDSEMHSKFTGVGGYQD